MMPACSKSIIDRAYNFLASVFPQKISLNYFSINQSRGKLLFLCFRRKGVQLKWGDTLPLVFKFEK